jgi:hypothetical protein
VFISPGEPVHLPCRAEIAHRIPYGDARSRFHLATAAAAKAGFP